MNTDVADSLPEPTNRALKKQVKTNKAATLLFLNTNMTFKKSGGRHTLGHCD